MSRNQKAGPGQQPRLNDSASATFRPWSTDLKRPVMLYRAAGAEYRVTALWPQPKPARLSVPRAYQSGAKVSTTNFSRAPGAAQRASFFGFSGGFGGGTRSPLPPLK